MKIEISQNSSVCKGCKEYVLFFPQMRPEKKAPEMTIDELDLFSNIPGMELLSVVKNKTGLSNKKWDKTLKSLTSKGFVKVTKTDEGLFITLL